jgi:Rad3-related DNA helicase
MKAYPQLVKQLDVCNKLLLELKRECETYQVHDNIGHFYIKLVNVYHQFEKIMEEHVKLEDDVLDFYFDVRFFLSVYEELDENYVIYTEMAENGEFRIKLYCVNPAFNLQKYLEYGNSTVFFSATLLPIHYYKKLLSVETDDYAVYAKSTFDEENRCLLIGNDVSTKYTQRSETMYQKYAAYIDAIVSAKEGNYLVFFPSYVFMEQVRQSFVAFEKPDVEVIMQDQGMRENQREEFLQLFERDREGSLVGFCVLGGVFSEGIDLTEERLIGAIIIGTGLPQVCHERELLKLHFDAQGENGFDYAYLYPGMNKVLQAAGRVIRTEKDTGIIALLDERFRGYEYRRTFPREWTHTELCTRNNVQTAVIEFWNKINQNN